MGTYIKYQAEKRGEDGEWENVASVNHFGLPSDYDLYGWLGLECRNYAAMPPLPTTHEGLPEGLEVAEWNFFNSGGPHWVLVKDLLEFNYDAPVENRRVLNGSDWRLTCERGKGEMTTYRNLFSATWFKDLEIMRETGATHLVFWFD